MKFLCGLDKDNNASFGALCKEIKNIFIVAPCIMDSLKILHTNERTVIL